MIEGPVEVFVNFFLVRDRDCDNLKVLLDVLEDRVIENDRQVEALHVFKAKDGEKPRVEVEVYEIPGQQTDPVITQRPLRSLTRSGEDCHWPE